MSSNNAFMRDLLGFNSLGGSDDPVINQFYDLLEEANETRSVFHTTWDEAARLMDGDHYAGEVNNTTRIDRLVLNRIYRAVTALAAVLTETRPRMVITPNEYGDEKLWYIDPKAGAMIRAAAQGGQKAAEIIKDIPIESISGQAPLPDAFLPILANAFGLGDNAFIGVDDDMVASAIHSINDQMWDLDQTDWKVAESTQAKLTYGHSPQLWQWSADENRWTSETPHVRNVWFDPNSHYGGEGQYTILAQRLDRDQAMHMYARDKEDEEAINESIITGDLGATAQQATGDARLGEPYHINYRRPMVDVYTTWKRNQLVDMPLSVEEAMQSGNVVQAEDGSLAVQKKKGLEATSQGADNWPTKKGRGIRQWVVVGNRTLDDRKCPYRDIPVTCDVNVPRQYSPYGYGEPEQLETLNRAINRLLTIHVEHTKHFQSPMEIVPESMNDAKKKQGRDYSFAGKKVVIPDDVLTALGRGAAGIWNFPPSLNASYVQFFQLLLQEFDKHSLNTDVIQGQPQSSGQSGKAIVALQSAGRGSIGYRALWAERSLSHAGRLTTGMITDFLPDDEWRRYLGKYPIAVLNALRSKAKQLKYDVDSEVGAGKGANNRQKFEEAIMLYNTTGGLAPSVQTMMERTNSFDTEEEFKRMAQEQGAQQQPQNKEGGS